MQIEDARVICPCMVHSPNAGDTARELPTRERSAWLLIVALVLAAVTLGFSVVSPAEFLVTTTDRRMSGLVKMEMDPGQVPMLAPGVRGEFATTLPPQEREQLRREFFETKIPFGGLIYREAMRNGLEPELVAAVVRAESGFFPENVSVKNAIGLMQLIPSTGELMGATDLMDPVENVRAGTKYLKYLAAEFEGDQILTLAAYNAGEGTVRRYDGVPPYRETKNYIRKVGRYRYAYSQAINRVVAARLAAH